MTKKIKFLPTNLPERKWLIKYSINANKFNVILYHFQHPRLVSDNKTNKLKYGPCGLSYEYQNYEWYKDYEVGEIWTPLMSIPDYNKQDAPNIPLESTDIYDCIYKLHDMFPQFTEYWDVIGGTKEEYLEDYLKNCESYEILVITTINDTTSVKSVVSYLDNCEINNVVFDKKLHKIVD